MCYDSDSIPIIHRTAIFDENVLKWLGVGAILNGLVKFIQAVESPAIVNSWTTMSVGLISSFSLGIIGTISRFTSIFFQYLAML